MALPISGGLNGVQLMWFKRSAKTELGSKSYNVKVKPDIIVIQIDHKCRHFGTEKNPNITKLLSLINLINYLEYFQLFNNSLDLSGHHVYQKSFSCT